LSADEFVLIAGMTAVTFLIRYSFFALGERLAFPPIVRKALKYVPPAVLTAIVLPMVLIPGGKTWNLDWRNAWLAGAVASGLLSWRFKNLLAAIAGGMIVYVLWKVLLA
jgi:branched-subunit amino acid transport protein